MAQLIIEVDDETVKEFGLEELEKMLQNFVESKGCKANMNSSTTKGQQKFVDDLKQSLREVELHQQGKIKLTSFNDMMDEL